MFLKEPKDNEKFSWTRHVKEKMKFYGLGERRLKHLLSKPKRKEEGVAPGTIAVMRSAGTKKNPTEIWLMYQIIKVKRREKIRIISAWRYPGISPLDKEIPIPKDILRDLDNLIRKK